MMNRQLAIILLCAGRFCNAQTVPAAAPQAAPEVSSEVTMLISASSKVPPVCVQKIMANPERSLSFLSNQLCATYLALTSKQYQALGEHNRDALATTLLKNDAVQSAAIMAFKSLSQQQGSSTGTGGSTNLTSKGVASQFLGLASEYGALTESTSGQTTTLSGTLAGIPMVFLRNGLIQYCPTNIYGFLGKNSLCTSPGLIANLSRIAYSVSINTSSGNQMQAATVNTTSTSPAVPATFLNNTSNQKVTAISGKWVAVQGKPTAADVAAAYQKVIDGHSQDNGHRAAMKLEQAESDSTAPQSEHEKIALQQIHELLKSNPKPYSREVTGQVIGIWKTLGTDIVASLGIPVNISPEEAANNEVLMTIPELAVSYVQTIAQQQAIGVAIARPAILTFEYDNNRPLSQPSNSVFRVIYQAKLGQVTLTANGAASIYDSTPSSAIPGAERLRDVQIAAQADRPFSIKLSADRKIDMTGSGSFYFQDQTSPSILNVTPGMPVSGVSFTGLPSTATQVFAQKGNIAIGQAKITIGSGSNLKIPLSVTYSNRTELVTSPTWRGQIGISYDFDSLFTKK